MAAFFGGIVFIGAIDKLIPASTNPHEARSEEELAPLHDPSAPPPGLSAAPGRATSLVADRRRPSIAKRGLMRMGLFTAAAIALHNVPEGLAICFSTLQDPTIGLAIAVAVALHNIPEGISVSVPIYYATGDRSKAFVYSLLSGLSEPAGAVIALGFLLLLADGAAAMPWHVVGMLLGGVAGIMVYISVDDLLPASRACGKGHDSLIGVVAGMAVMALSLLLIQ